MEVFNMKVLRRFIDFILGIVIIPIALAFALIYGIRAALFGEWRDYWNDVSSAITSTIKSAYETETKPVNKIGFDIH